MATAPFIMESRRAPRDVVSIRAPLDGPSGARSTALVVDISRFGFMSRTSAPLQPGDLIAVKLPVVGMCPARVVWSLGGRVGGEFITPIASDIYSRMLANAPNDKPAWNEF
jgi:hypothetical protein